MARVDGDPTWRVQPRDEVLVDLRPIEPRSPDRPACLGCPVDVRRIDGDTTRTEEARIDQRRGGTGAIEVRSTDRMAQATVVRPVEMGLTGRQGREARARRR